jgi:hypothetical protein
MNLGVSFTQPQSLMQSQEEKKTSGSRNESRGDRKDDGPSDTIGTIDNLYPTQQIANLLSDDQASFNY